MPCSASVLPMRWTSSVTSGSSWPPEDSKRTCVMATLPSSETWRRPSVSWASRSPWSSWVSPASSSASAAASSSSPASSSARLAASCSSPASSSASAAASCSSAAAAMAGGIISAEASSSARWASRASRPASSSASPSSSWARPCSSCSRPASSSARPASSSSRPAAISSRLPSSCSWVAKGSVDSTTPSSSVHCSVTSATAARCSSVKPSSVEKVTVPMPAAASGISSWRSSSTSWKRLPGMVNSSLSGALSVAAPVAASAMTTSQVMTVAQRCRALHRPRRCRSEATGVPSGVWWCGKTSGGGPAPPGVGVGEDPLEGLVEGGDGVGRGQLDRAGEPGPLDALEHGHDGGRERADPQVVVAAEAAAQHVHEPLLVVLPHAQPQVLAAQRAPGGGGEPAEEDLGADRLLAQGRADGDERLLLGGAPAQGVGHALQRLGQPGGDDALDAGEVVEEGAPRDARAVGDVPGGHVLQAALTRQLACGVDHRPAGARLVELAATGGFGHSDQCPAVSAHRATLRGVQWRT